MPTILRDRGKYRTESARCRHECIRLRGIGHLCNPSRSRRRRNSSSLRNRMKNRIEHTGNPIRYHRAAETDE